MKLKIQTSALLGALESLRPVYSGRTTLPALSMVKLVAAGRLTVSANNLDLFCASSCEADISDPGEFAVSGLRLLNAAKSCGGEEIELGVREKSLHFKSGKSAMRMSGLAVEEIPEDTKCAPTSECAMAASELSQALGETLPFVSIEPTRYTLCGVYFESNTGGLSLVATDGRAMSVRLIEAKSEGIAAIIPTDAARLLNDLRGEVRMGFSENSFSADTGDIKIVGKLVEGIYPNYKQIIPATKEQSVRVVIDRKALLAALPFLSLSESATSRPSVNVTISRDGLSLRSKTDTSDGTREVLAKVTGNGFETRFEVAFLHRVLSAHHKDEITLLFRDAISPLLIDHDGGQTVVLCMRILEVVGAEARTNREVIPVDAAQPHGVE